MSIQQAQELRDERCKLIADARTIMDSAETLDAEQRQQVDTMLDDSDLLKKDIDRVEALMAEERAIQESVGKSSELSLAQPQQEERATGVKSKEYREAFWEYLRGGKELLSPEHRAIMVEGTAIDGGFAAPMFDDGQAILQDLIIETMDSAQNFQQYATSITIGGEITVPVQNAVGTAAWTGENVDATASSTTFTQLKFQPHKASRIVQVSQELLADAYVDMQGFMAGMFGRSFADLLNTAFITGNTATPEVNPLGITDSATDSGVSVASATVVTWDELQGLLYSVKESYRANGTWLFNSTVASNIRGLKTDGYGYLWQPNGQLGQPDLLLGRPVAINDACEAMTSGLKPILFGDLSYYWIAWRAGMNFQRLDELYALAGNIGLKADLRVDGKLTSAESVKCLTMG